MNNKKPISQIIKELREIKGITQSKLAKLSGIHLSTIKKLESGCTPKPTTDTLNKLAKVLGEEIYDNILIHRGQHGIKPKTT